MAPLFTFWWEKHSKDHNYIPTQRNPCSVFFPKPPTVCDQKSACVFVKKVKWHYLSVSKKCVWCYKFKNPNRGNTFFSKFKGPSVLRFSFKQHLSPRNTIILSIEGLFRIFRKGRKHSSFEAFFSFFINTFRYTSGKKYLSDKWTSFWFKLCRETGHIEETNTRLTTDRSKHYSQWNYVGGGGVSVIGHL